MEMKQEPCASPPPEGSRSRKVRNDDNLVEIFFKPSFVRETFKKERFESNLLDFNMNKTGSIAFMHRYQYHV